MIPVANLTFNSGEMEPYRVNQKTSIIAESWIWLLNVSSV